MKHLLILIIALSSGLANSAEFIDSSVWSMTGPEMLTPTRFTYLKDVQYTHMSNPSTHGMLVVVENGKKLVESKVNGCGRPKRLNEKLFISSGCGFASIYDYDGQLLLEKTLTTDLKEKDLVVNVGSMLYLASLPASTLIDLNDLSEKELNCENSSLERIFNSQNNIFAQARTGALYQLTGTDCKKVAQVDQPITHLANSGTTIAVRTQDTNVSIYNASGKLVREVEADNDNDHPVVSARSAIFPASNGNVLIFIRSITAKYHSGWFGGSWHYTTWNNMYVYGPTGKLLKKKLFGTNTNITSITQAQDKNILLVTQSNDNGSYEKTTELLSSDNLSTVWKNSDAAIKYTSSWATSAAGILVGNLGEVLNAGTGKLIAPAKIDYAQDDVASVLDAKNFMIWQYKSVYNGPGQWALKYILVNE